MQCQKQGVADDKKLSIHGLNRDQCTQEDALRNVDLCLQMILQLRRDHCRCGMGVALTWGEHTLLLALSTHWQVENATVHDVSLP